jgi:polar amino acid transport system substrate-binding protein
MGFVPLRHLVFGFALMLAACASFGAPVLAQGPPAATAAPRADIAVPSLWDPARRPERPDLSRLTGAVRFLTETDFPPFNYAGPDGNPVGFNVDLARAVCAELGLRCTVQMRRFDTLVDALGANQGDAVIASLKPSADLRLKVDMTDPYYRTPGRFLTRLGAPALQGDLAGKRIAVVAGSAHEAFVALFFPAARLVALADLAVARQALKSGDVDALFADAIQSSLWLNGTASAGCCAFAGGPYLESRFFGEGIGIAVRKGNDTLRRALNWGLFRVWEKGEFARLWLTYFPVSPF